MRCAGVGTFAVLVLLVPFAFSQEGGAPSSGDLSSQLQSAADRLDAANRRISELEGKVNALDASLSSSSTQASGLSAQLKALEEKARAGKAEAPSAKVTPYGQIKIDMAVNSDGTNSTDDPTYVTQQTPGFGNDRSFSITARQTQLGLNIQTEDIAGGRSRGKVEIDFYGQAAVETKAQPRLRYAYWELAYPDWSILAGATMDVMSPIYPSTLNRPHLDQSGNIGYRRPMVRYERLFKAGDDTITADIAIARGTASPIFSSTTLDDPGSDAGWPVIEARTGITIPTGLKRPVVFGISGHVGQEEYDKTVLVAGPPASLKTVSGDGDMYMTYSGCLDWSVPLAEKWDLNGEFFMGRNLDDFVGGIGQGVNTPATQGAKDAASALNEPIDAMGGWSQIVFKAAKSWTFSAGAGIDDPQNSDLSGAINRTQNVTYFTNAVYALNDKVSVGVEAAYMRTNYLTGNDGDNLRVESSLIYKF